MKKNEHNKLVTAYAEALFEASENDNTLDKVFAETSMLQRELSADNSVAVKYLSSPFWNNDDKKQALESIAQKFDLSLTMTNLLKVLTDNGRAGLLNQVLTEFTNVYYRHRHIIPVTVKTAIELTQNQKQKLIEAMENYVGKKVVINYKIIPEILGGLLVECNSEMIDDSLKGKLDRLESLMKGTV